MICVACTTESQPTRDCALCGETSCRHHARKQIDLEGIESIVCKEPFDCLKRVGADFRRENRMNENSK